MSLKVSRKMSSLNSLPSNLLLGVLASSLGVFGTLVFSSPTHAAGKPRPQPTPDPVKVPAMTQPSPVHPVHLLEVGTQAFHLPNGAKIDLTADLPQILETSISATPNFRVVNSTLSNGPLISPVADPCVPHLELKAAITSLDLNVAGVGIKFGYSPTGETGTVTNMNGKVQLNVGLLAMDFSVRSCLNGQCETAVATYTTHATTDVSGQIEIDFGQIKTGTDFLFKTALGKLIRSSMDAGMQKLAASPYLDRLPWKTSVTFFDPNTGEVTLGAGAESNLTGRQTFGVYQEIPSAGICPAYRSIAYIHTDRVDVGTSTAIIDQSFEGAIVKVGDTIRIRAAK
ncbi:MAG: hypothetical protein H7222_04035 [Methylotenera sp.]|nr:hypothetical protein [Oligoflexia bacterium]